VRDAEPHHGHARVAGERTVVHPDSEKIAVRRALGADYLAMRASS
jgi:hypothetical protein